MKKEIKEMVLKIVDDCFYIFASGYREEAENNARIVFEELYPQLSQPKGMTKSKVGRKKK